MTQFSMRGELLKRSTSRLLSIPIKQAFRPDASLRDVGPPATFEAADDDVVEVELENGIVFWTSLGQLRADAGDLAVRDTEPNSLPLRYPQAGAAERGVVDVAIRFLKVLDVDVPKGGALLAARRLESQLAGDPGFYRIDETGKLHRVDGLDPGSEPVLIFVHGTASSTSAAFGSLFAANELSGFWTELHQRYRGRVYGFENKSLTESPVENATLFLEALPDRNVPPLHMVSHSRGGLIGDLIAHGEVQEAFPRELLIASGADEEQAKQFRSLSRLLAIKKPRLTRFVRVACPAAGTTLASGRLDIYVSILINLVAKTPLAGPFLEGLGELVAAVAKERAKPKVLPGLAAQIPGSPLIRVLNGSPHVLESDLTVIAGDSDGPLGALGNLFYWHANDLVVDTDSMFRGTPRKARRWYKSAGWGVHHLNYFDRQKTVQKMVEGLTRADTSDAGFETTRPRSALRGALRSSVPAGDPRELADQPAVILIPGIMGSHLSLVQQGLRNRIWLDLSDLMKGRFKQLAIGATGVEPDGLVESAYGDFAAFLRSRQHHVVPFAYDWRDSLGKAVPALNELVKTRLEASKQPLRIVAHSMGGLVARLFIARYPDTWRKVANGGGSLLQAGTPNGGSHVIPQLLLGQEKLLRILAAVDLGHEKEDWAEMLARFPGLLEMAPQAEEADDGLDIALWSDLKTEDLQAPSAKDLKAAGAVVKEIRAVDLAQHPVVYVAGRADKTPILTSDRKKLTSTPRGDGRVTWDSGIPAGIKHWYVDAAHGDLLACRPAFAGLLELIETGDTRLLATQEPRPRQAPTSSRGTLAQEEIETFPSQRSLEAAALGMSDDQERHVAAAAGPTCAVRVVHGNLAYARHPVMVGHYSGDPILNAEMALDRALQGALSHRLQLDLYPRGIGTNEIVLSSKSAQGRPTGAVIVGLDAAGELSPGGLSRTVEEGVVRYVQQAHESEFSRQPASAGWGLTSILIGSGEAGLSLPQVVESILRGVRQANHRLQVFSTPEQPFPGIVELELLELWEDRALAAAHVLKELSSWSLEGFVAEETLDRRDGGLRRLRLTEPAGWWTPLSIRQSHDDPDRLEFSAFGRRARVDELPLPVQVRLIEALLRHPQESASATHRDLTMTLFELLLPQRLKGAARNQSNVLLVLDESTARFPWELLVDRMTEGAEPISVNAGLVRKLRVDRPEHVSHPEGYRALVIGEPPSGATPLPGARKEALEVAQSIENRPHWRVDRQIAGDSASRKTRGNLEIDTESIMTTAMTGDYRIIHMAGHGHYDPEHPGRTGLVLEWDSSRPEACVFFSPIEAAQMRLTPELVFINCCHLGRIETTPPHLLAANLATQFIRKGVRCVVAAGWAVDDAAALTFADVFYQRILRGENFGDAVLNARRETFNLHPDSNTWAAYQCYGDPGFRLTRSDDSYAGSRDQKRKEFVDPAEVVCELSEVGLDRGDRAQKDLEQLVELSRQHGWLSLPEIKVALARAYANRSDLGEAVSMYEQAREGESGSMSLRDLEQLANLRARHAAKLAEDKRLTKSRAKRWIRQSIDELEGLIQISGTRERYSLLGSAFKRRARVGKPSKEDLRSMTAAYAKACELDSSDLYATLNALSGVLVLGGPSKDVAFEPGLRLRTPTEFEATLARAKTRARLAADQAAGFWDRTYVPDTALVAALHAGSPMAHSDNLKALYRDLLSRDSSPRERDSVTDQLAFLQHCFDTMVSNLKGKADADTALKVCRARAELVEALLAHLRP